jgi:hypothetical protein
MYRQYEDPHKVEKLLKEAEERYERALQEDPENTDLLFDLYTEMEMMRDRVRFAWDDDEYDENYELYGG